MGSFDFFEETAPRKTAENTAKHRDGGSILLHMSINVRKCKHETVQFVQQ